MDRFEDYEIEDFDAELLNRGDYEAVLQLRQNQLKKHPYDYRTNYRWAEILELTKRFDEALLVLSKLHKEDTEDGDVIYLILDCLRKTNQRPDDFKWGHKPEIIFLNQELIESINIHIKGKRGDKRSIETIYINFLFEAGYPFFDEQDLFEYLVQSNRVRVKGEAWYDARIEKIS